MEKELHLQLGASTYHKGIDIGAPEGFEFVAVTDGTITQDEFNSILDIKVTYKVLVNEKKELPEVEESSLVARRK